MEYYSAIKRSKLKPFEAVGMKLGIIILLKSENDKYHMWNLTF